MIDDLPYRIGNWTPKNYANKYRGPIPIYTALMISSNVCTARLMDAIGVRPVIQLARVMGITTPIPYDYTISLGSNSVKLFEMTRFTEDESVARFARKLKGMGIEDDLEALGAKRGDEIKIKDYINKINKIQKNMLF